MNKTKTKGKWPIAEKAILLAVVFIYFSSLTVIAISHSSTAYYAESVISYEVGRIYCPNLPFYLSESGFVKTFIDDCAKAELKHENGSPITDHDLLSLSYFRIEIDTGSFILGSRSAQEKTLVVTFTKQYSVTATNYLNARYGTAGTIVFEEALFKEQYINGPKELHYLPQNLLLGFGSATLLSFFSICAYAWLRRTRS